jgi:hypothetical protein
VGRREERELNKGEWKKRKHHKGETKVKVELILSTNNTFHFTSPHLQLIIQGVYSGQTPHTHYNHNHQQLPISIQKKTTK